MSEKLLYEGKAKKIFSTDDADIVRVAYKNDTTAFNGEKFEHSKARASSIMKSLLSSSTIWLSKVSKVTLSGKFLTQNN